MSRMRCEASGEQVLSLSESQWPGQRRRLRKEKQMGFSPCPLELGLSSGGGVDGKCQERSKQSSRRGSGKMAEGGGDSNCLYSRPLCSNWRLDDDAAASREFAFWG